MHVDAGYPVQKLEASEVSSHPELNLQPTSFVMTPQGDTEPTAKVVLRFDNYTAMHEVAANMKGVDVSDSFNTENLTVEKAVADITADGKFSVDSLDLPFTLLVSDLETDNETVNALKKLELPGKLYGSLASPRIKVELNDQLKDAVVDAAKEKAKEEAQKEAEKQMNKALESDEAQDLKNKASEGLKKLF